MLLWFGILVKEGKLSEQPEIDTALKGIEQSIEVDEAIALSSYHVGLPKEDTFVIHDYPLLSL